MDNERRRRTAARNSPTGALIFSALLLATPGLQAQAAPPLMPLLPEAPSSLFKAELGAGKDASLLVQGSWELNLLGSIRLGFDSSGIPSLAGSQPLLFMQHPDLFLSFLLFDQLFVEARVSEDLAQTRYTAGWRGKEGEVLRELRIGNQGIGFPDLPWLSLGGGSLGSFGARASFADLPFSGEAILRYDQAERAEKRFLGGAELVESSIDIRDFLAGRWFRIQPGIGDLRLYLGSASTVEVRDQAGYGYRRLGAEEYSHAAATGLLSLAKAATTRLVAVHASTAGGAVDLGELGRGELLFDPEAAPGASLLLSRYPRQGKEEAEAWVRDRASGKRDEDFEVVADGDRLEVRRLGDADGSRPFALSDPWIYELGQAAESAWRREPSREIVARSYGARGSLLIGTDYIPGSVEVFRDGRPEGGFSMDSGGELILAVPLGPAEELRVTWLRASAERRTGSLAAGVAGRLAIGEGSEAWLGLASRWSLPGESYAAGGETNPGWLSLSAGARGASGGLAYSLAAAGSWNVEEASGRYRIDGMESSPTSQASSTWIPAATPPPAGFAVEESLDESLAEDFPGLAARLHKDGVAQRALKVAVPAGASGFELVKYLEAPPFGRFRTFSFLAKGPADGRLRLSFGDGSGEKLVMELPLDSLSPLSWRRFSLRYGAGDLRVLRETAEGAEATALGGLAAYEALLEGGGRARLAFDSAGGGQFAIDELLLEDSNGRLSLAGAGELSFSLPGFAPGGDKAPLRGLSLALEGRGSLSSPTGDSSAAALLAAASLSGSLASGGGPLRLGLRAAARARDGQLFLAAGHELGFSLGGLLLADRFDLDPETGSLGRQDRLELSLGRPLGLSLSQESAWSPGLAAGQGDSGLLSQEWKASLRLLSLLKGDLSARARARPGAPPLALVDPGLAAYPETWLGAFALVLPQAEDAAIRRDVKGGLGLSLPGGAELARLELGVEADPAADPRRKGRELLDLRLPLSFGAIELELGYRRDWSARLPGAGSGLVDLGFLAADDFLAATPFLTRAFLSELWSDAAARAFEEESFRGHGFLSPVYAPRASLRLSRPFGSSLLDLFLPSRLELAFQREFSREGDLLLDKRVAEGQLASSALNLFGSAGSRPLSSGFESDEYLLSTRGRYAWTEGGAPAWELGLSLLGSFYGSAERGSPDSLVLGSKLLIANSSASSSWKESLEASLSLRRERHVLLDLYEAAVAGGMGLLAAKAEPAGGEGSLASSWLRSIAGGRPRARSLLTLAGDIGGGRSDAKAPSLAFSASQGLEQRVSLPGILLATAKLLMKESMDAAGGIAIEASLSLGLSLSF